jgi:hypothetical protein
MRKVPTGRGRPTLKRAALLWEFRRGKALVDVLAQSTEVEPLKRLARGWTLDPSGDYVALVYRLACHCLEQYRANTQEETS